MFSTRQFAHIFLAAIFASGLVIRLFLQYDFERVFLWEIENLMDFERYSTSDVPQVSNIVLEME
jgi:nitrate reductase gamma subunit